MEELGGLGVSVIPRSEIPLTRPRVSKELSAKRVSVCQGCDKLSGMTCTLKESSVFNMARFEENVCPLNKWEE
jgi:hypothetical protein